MKYIIKKKFSKKPKITNPILIEGLPGIGNVGKITVDFLVEELAAEKLYEIYSSSFPHSVFITEESLIELPKVEIHLLRTKKQDFLILSGDIQPIREVASYDFAEKIIDLCADFGCKEVVTLGGIGLPGNPKENRVFIVATDSKTLKKYKKKSSEIKLKGNTAATIVGAAGLLLGVGKLHAWSGFSLLIETFGDPYHLGLLEAQKLVAVLKDIFDFDIDLKKLEKEIKHVEKAEKIEHSEILKKLKKMGGESDTSYIG